MSSAQTMTTMAALNGAHMRSRFLNRRRPTNPVVYVFGYPYLKYGFRRVVGEQEPGITSRGQ